MKINEYPLYKMTLDELEDLRALIDITLFRRRGNEPLPHHPDEEDYSDEMGNK